MTPDTTRASGAKRAFAATLFDYGFRPFFLMAALFSPLAILIWIGVYSGALAPVSAMPPNLWHAHEMLFGYAIAVMTGFFLTAIPNWTGAPPLRGRPLALLASLWLAGRVAVWLSGFLPAVVVATVDISYVVVLALLIAPMLGQGARKNLVFLFVLAGFAAANILFHLDALAVSQHAPLGLNFAVDLFAVLISIIGGRVTPAFTGNALRARAERTGKPPVGIAGRPGLDRAAILSVVLVAFLDLFAAGQAWVGWFALAAALLNLLRLAGWRALWVLNEPLLWVLHLGYLWLVLGLAAKGYAALTGIVPATVALHGITIGAIGTMTLAMMSRASLGHTGRGLTAGLGLAFAYLLVSAAAAVRLAMPALAPERYLESVEIAGALWIAAFVVFAAKFAPILTRPRADGR